MNNIDLKKRKILRYLGTKKYKLSFWGITPHFDWHMLILYFFISLMIVFTFGYIKTKESISFINKEIVLEKENIKKIDFLKFKKILEESYGLTISEE